MSSRQKVSSDAYVLLLLLLFCGVTVSCAPTLIGPTEPNSSLIIGRMVIENKYRGAFLGLLPLGMLDKGIEVEIESPDGTHSFKAITQDQGYFIIPNIPPNTYHVLRVTIEGGNDRGTEKFPLAIRRLTFTPILGKIGYIGTLMVDVSDRGFTTIREVREEERARAYFLQKHGGSPWASREFVSVGPKPTPGMQLTQQR